MLLEPATVASAIIKEADKNGDSTLNKDELLTAPAILRALEQYDTDHNSEVTLQEIENRITKWQQLKVAVVSCSFIVKLDGKPLTDAEVELIPEPCMGGTLPKCAGRTDVTGRVAPTIVADANTPAGQEILPGVPPGLYRVSVRHSRLQNLSQYNSATTLGLQVAPDDPNLMTLEFDLQP